MPQWEVAIGLEVHIQLATRSKLFSAAATAFGAEPNSQACAVDLALPGTLPVVNAEAIRMAALFGLAVGGEVARHSVFARKHYFYPDLPRGFQTTQFSEPIVSGGHLNFNLTDGTECQVRFERAHLEEDAGKSLHQEFSGLTAVDLNRAGVPLLEIVTLPDLCSSEQAEAFLRTLHNLVTTLKICDGALSQGSMRCDVNVSLRPQGQKQLGERTEMKNLNSFRFVRKAIDGEIERQQELLENGSKVLRQTLLYDSQNDCTRPMRSKEQELDYRYFPDPDLLPVAITDSMLSQWRTQLPELPQQKRDRLALDYSLQSIECDWLIADTQRVDYFEALVACCSDARQSINWMRGDLAAVLNQRELAIADSPVSAAQLGKLIARLKDGTITGKSAKKLFEELCKDGVGQSVDELIESLGLSQMQDSAAVIALVLEVLADNPDQVAHYRAAAAVKRKKMLGYFVGQVMQRSAGKAKPSLVNAELIARLDSKVENDEER